MVSVTFLSIERVAFPLLTAGAVFMLGLLTLLPLGATSNNRRDAEIRTISRNLEGVTLGMQVDQFLRDFPDSSEETQLGPKPEEKRIFRVGRSRLPRGAAYMRVTFKNGIAQGIAVDYIDTPGSGMPCERLASRFETGYGRPEDGENGKLLWGDSKTLLSLSPRDQSTVGSSRCRVQIVTSEETPGIEKPNLWLGFWDTMMAFLNYFVDAISPRRSR